MLCDYILFWHEHAKVPLLRSDEMLDADGKVVPRPTFRIEIDFAPLVAGLQRATEALVEFGRAVGRIKARNAGRPINAGRKRK